MRTWSPHLGSAWSGGCLDEYGLYGFFAGNCDEFFHSYYRTDRTFQEEGQLLYDDD